MKEENPDICNWYLNDADQPGERSWNKRGESGSISTAQKFQIFQTFPKMVGKGGPANTVLPRLISLGKKAF